MKATTTKDTLRPAVRRILVLLGGAAILASAPLRAQSADLYMKDRATDTGVEPNPDTGPMWVTEDIWVRRSPDPGYRPQPFAEASPPWIPLPHENPEYRDPKYSLPNYIYVRVRNRGTAASTGTERLRVYWAKASTGLSWPTHWVDYLASNCGPIKLYAAEVTKPRKNAATATSAERDAYRQAIVSIGTLPSFVFPGHSYWHKQDVVHQFGPPNRHGSPAFLPWHREFINRYEALLQEANPTVKLLYWDWTTDPENSTGGVNLFTAAFMGASGRGTGGVSAGLPFQPALGSPAITRDLSSNTTPPASSDASLVGLGVYQTFAPTLEQVPNHDASHGYIGGVNGGNMSSIPTAAEDPFFFLLHTNADRLWARWQRNPANLSRLDPATAYDGFASNANITSVMGPWNGAGTIQPWTTSGGSIVSKAPTHASVVSPPFYDTAPLVIPVLQPGQAAVIQIPWYPPNPADFACFGDQQHFCLLGRIETAAAAPFGMTVPETGDVNANTRSNNNIVWKNLSVVDNFPGALGLRAPGPVGAASLLVRNPFRERVATTLRFVDADEIGRSFLQVGRITVDLKPELFRRWRASGGKGQGVEPIGGDSLVQISSPDATIAGIVLNPGEVFPVGVRFELPKDYRPPRGVLPSWDFIQTGAPDRPDTTVGGVRFAIDFDKLGLIWTGDTWRYLDDGSDPGRAWIGADFDDSKWKLGRAELGFGDDPTTTIDIGPPDRRRITTYFRRVFEVPDPQFFRTLLARLKRDDGAVVYLNGVEIHRVNLPSQALSPLTPASRAVSGVEEDMFFPIEVDPGLLRPGPNVVAVEVHQDSSRTLDASFDLELAGNRSFSRFAPEVRIVTPPLGALLQAGRALPVNVDALDSDGRVSSVSLLVDGRPIETRREPPFTFQWPGARLGRHRLRAIAVDNEGQRGIADVAVTVVANTPPGARLRRPADGSVFAPGAPVPVRAEAWDTGGKVSRVDFFVRDADRFVAPTQRVGRVSTPPYAVSIAGLAPGHYMLIAHAVDDQGAVGPSVPVHFTVRR